MRLMSKRARVMSSTLPHRPTCGPRSVPGKPSFGPPKDRCQLPIGGQRQRPKSWCTRTFRNAYQSPPAIDFLGPDYTPELLIPEDSARVTKQGLKQAALSSMGALDLSGVTVSDELQIFWPVCQNESSWSARQNCPGGKIKAVEVETPVIK